MGKRADGELEREVLAVLWSTTDPLSIADVQSQLRGDLAYTTVATVLGRLVTKGSATRLSLGRAYAYQAAITRDEWFASKMVAVLNDTPNHRRLLAGFVNKLSARDRESLRALLDDETEAE